MNAHDALDLLDWKRHIFELYRYVRMEPDRLKSWEVWKFGRDDLFRTHPQSPLPPPERAGFMGIDYFDYDERAVTVAEIDAADPEIYDLPSSGDAPMRFTRVGTARFELFGKDAALELYWLAAYGGGLFLPFSDATSGRETYGAGRYLLDSVKGADLGNRDGSLVLDFNFAYNPSCAYDPKWACPLAPPANRLDFPIPAGERSGGPRGTP